MTRQIQQRADKFDVLVVGGYPLYRLAMRNLLHKLIPAAYIDETPQLDTPHAIEQCWNSHFIVFLDPESYRDFVCQIRPDHFVKPFLILFTACIGDVLRTQLKQDLLTAVLPLTLPLADTETYLRTLLVEGDISVGKHLLKDSALQERFLPDLDDLTRREKQVLSLLGEGLETDGIAEKLSIERNTVKVFIGRVYRKCRIINRTQAASLMRSLECANY